MRIGACFGAGSHRVYIKTPKISHRIHNPLSKISHPMKGPLKISRSPKNVLKWECKCLKPTTKEHHEDPQV
jgi:hypothetical protein